MRRCVSQGRVADMGMGSGSGSQTLAALYPGLEVVGVDVDPNMVELARHRHQLPNLRFIQGDIAEQVFAPKSIDSIFDSSVLHHVTSFGGYRHENAARALEVQVGQLRPGGVLIVRDFVDPGEGTVLLDLPAEDGDDSDDPRRCSTAHLLERFAREFRALHDAPGFACERVEADDLASAWRRYRLSLKHAAEFVLRKDYRADWEAEVRLRSVVRRARSARARLDAAVEPLDRPAPVHGPILSARPGRQPACVSADELRHRRGEGPAGRGRAFPRSR